MTTHTFNAPYSADPDIRAASQVGNGALLSGDASRLSACRRRAAGADSPLDQGINPGVGVRVCERVTCSKRLGMQRDGLDLD